MRKGRVTGNAASARIRAADATDAAFRIGWQTMTAFAARGGGKISERMRPSGPVDGPAEGVLVRSRVDRHRGAGITLAAAPQCDHKEQYNTVVKYLHRIIS